MKDYELTLEQLLELTAKRKIIVTVQLIERDAMLPTGWRHDLWRAKLSANGFEHVAEYRTGVGHRSWDAGYRVSEYDGKHEGKRMARPDEVKARKDLVPCLLLDSSTFDTYTMDEICSEYLGGLKPSEMLAAYLEMQKTSEAMRKLFGPDYDKAVELAGRV